MQKATVAKVVAVLNANNSCTSSTETREVDLWSISEIKVLLSQGQGTSILAPSVLIKVLHGMGRVATEFLVC